MIEVKNLVKSYNGHLAVDDLSFTVEKGQIVGFLGPNGAGKSTTMNIITGYISATDGQVLVNGIDIFDEPEKVKKSIGYLPESPPLYMDMRVREYLFFVASLKKVPRGERIKMLDEIMRLTKITDVSERLIKHLSKGYRQRVGLAGSLIGYPEILILDEPTVGLDPMQIIEMRDLIKSLSKKHTILLSSHIMQEISAVCDKVMIINQGKMVVSDKPENISKRIQESEELVLRVKGSKEKIQEALEGVKGIDQFHIEAMDSEGRSSISIKMKEGEDCRESLFYAMAKMKCPILEMKTNIMTLEDIFLTLTKGGTKQYGGRKDKRKWMNGRKNRKEDLVLQGDGEDNPQGASLDDVWKEEDFEAKEPIVEEPSGQDKGMEKNVPKEASAQIGDASDDKKETVQLKKEGE